MIATRYNRAAAVDVRWLECNVNVGDILAK